MTIEKQAAIAGVLGGTIFCAFLGWGLRSVEAHYGIVGLAAVAIPSIASCLLIAWMMDRKAAADLERARSDLRSMRLPDRFDQDPG